MAVDLECATAYTPQRTLEIATAFFGGGGLGLDLAGLSAAQARFRKPEGVISVDVRRRDGGAEVHLRCDAADCENESRRFIAMLCRAAPVPPARG